MMTSGFSLPPTTGHHPIGTATLEVVDHSRLDPFSPGRELRRLILTIFYPADQCTDSRATAPYLPPRTAAIFADGFGVSIDSLRSLKMNAITAAPYADEDNFPIVLFSPGFRVPRLLYGGLAENLASYGYLVITVDHPYDSILIEYSDGQLVMPQLSNGTNHTQIPNVDDVVGLNHAIDVRVQDLSFVLDQLLNNSTIFAQHIPNFPSATQILQSKVGVFGHSLGGATSATLMSHDRRFLCGASLDGKLSGTVVEQGLDRPFLLVGAEGNTLNNVSGWADFWDNLRSFRRHITIKGTIHGSFEDIPLLAETYANASPDGTPPPNLIFESETIKGSRVREIVTVYIESLLNMCLKNGSAFLLANPVSQYPEVMFGH